MEQDTAATLRNIKQRPGLRAAQRTGRAAEYKTLIPRTQNTERQRCTATLQTTPLLRHQQKMSFFYFTNCPLFTWGCKHEKRHHLQHTGNSPVQTLKRAFLIYRGRYTSVRGPQWCFTVAGVFVCLQLHEMGAGAGERLVVVDEAEVRARALPAVSGTGVWS